MFCLSISCWILGCFHFFAITGNVSVNIHVQVFAWVYVLNSLNTYIHTHSKMRLTEVGKV